MILIVAALAEEIRAFSDELKETRLDRSFPFPVLSGSIEGFGNVSLGITGSGKVQASIHTASLIARLDPDRVYGVGVAGAIEKSFSVGDLVQVKEAIQYDLNIGRFGLGRGMINGVLPTYVRASLSDDRFPAVRCGTADQFLTGKYVKKNPWIIEELELQIADMESYCMLAAAEELHIPSIVYRVISDTISGEKVKDFKSFMNTASRQLFDAVYEHVSHNS